MWSVTFPRLWSFSDCQYSWFCQLGNDRQAAFARKFDWLATPDETRLPLGLYILDDPEDRTR